MTQQQMQVLLAATLIQPTAHLTDAEAAERGEALRQQQKQYPTGGEYAGVAHNPEFRAFARDWQRMMVREGEEAR